MIDITNEQYHNDTTRISKSGLDLINRSPAHYYARYLDPTREPERKTAALIDGTAVHTAILEPRKFKDRYIVDPGFDRRTNAGKADLALFVRNYPGKELLSKDTYYMAMKLREAMEKHPVAKRLLEDGVPEETLHWQDRLTGAPCKARMDWLSGRFIVDIKTTEDASPRAFGRSANTYRYPVQSAFYYDGMVANDREVEGFIFIAVEKSPPYGVALYFSGDAEINLGRQLYLKNLETYMACVRSGTWPGYPHEVTQLRLPDWAYKTDNL